MDKSMIPALIAAAEAAGEAAGSRHVPVPMVVGEADGFSNRFKPGAVLEVVNDGVCGFAWIKVRPGNSPVANYLKRTGKGHTSYSGGVDVWVSGFNQSMERKEAYANAYAKVLQAAGVTAYSQSRMD